MSEIRGRPSVSRRGAAVAERRIRLSGLRIQREEPMPAVQEEPHPAAAITPERGPAQLPSAAGQERTELLGLAVEPPLLLAGFGIDGGDVVVRRRHVQHAVDHERRALEEAGRRRRFPVLPLPGHLQAAARSPGRYRSAASTSCRPDRRRSRATRPALIPSAAARRRATRRQE